MAEILNTQLGSPDGTRGVKIHDKGFSLISRGIDPVVDIVFIHGLQGHPKETWKYNKPTTPGGSHSQSGILSWFARLKRRKPDSISSSLVDPEVFWPLDLLAKDIKDARILTFGYDSHVTRFFGGPANQNNITAHGQDLLTALERVRRISFQKQTGPGDPQRAIIFVVHSLGGLILKEVSTPGLPNETALFSNDTQTLRRAKDPGPGKRHLRSVYDSTQAIIFLGTPHRGSSYEAWGQLARRAAVSAGFDANDRVLRDLRIDSQMLEILRESFSQIIQDKKLHFHSFQEAHGYKGTGLLGANRKVVDDHSSAIEHSEYETKEHISATHQEMCRFRDSDDEGYIKVFGAIDLYLSVIRKAVLVRREEDQMKRCLQLLSIPGLEYQDQIENPYGTTYKWIWEEAEFSQWLKRLNGVYWIRGKPGSGKSTIMKYIFTHLPYQQRSSADLPPCITAAFFFQDRGSAVQKSIRGLLCALLHQIISAQKLFVHEVWPILFGSGETSATNASIEKLKSAMRAIIHSKRVSANICLFIDAIDEHDASERDQVAVARFLSELASPGSDSVQVNTKVCLASRDTNAFQDVLGNFHEISMDQLTHSDILEYVKGNLSSHPVAAQSDFRREGVARLAEKVVELADGVFLWVKLVVDQLDEGLTNGETFEELERFLNDLPKEIQDLYRGILKRVDDKYRFEAYIMVQVVLCALEPLSVEDFWYVVQKALGVQGPLTIHDIRRRIKSRCRGLVEMRRDDVPLGSTGLNVASFQKSRAAVEESRVQDPASQRFLWSTVYLRPAKGSFVVQFLHQTAKEFAASYENISILARKPEEDGNSWLLQAAVKMMISACKGCLECTSFDPLNRSRDRSIAVSIAKVFDLAMRAEKALCRSFVTPLLDLDKALRKNVDKNWTQTFLLPAEAGNPGDVTSLNLWYTFSFEYWEPERSFLCLLATARLTISFGDAMRALIDMGQPFNIQNLIYYALRPSLSKHGLEQEAFGDTLCIFRLLASSESRIPKSHSELSALSYMAQYLLWNDIRIATEEERGTNGSVGEFLGEVFDTLLRGHPCLEKKISYKSEQEEDLETARDGPNLYQTCGNPRSYQASTLSFYRPSGRHANHVRPFDPWCYPIHAIIRLDHVVTLEKLQEYGANLRLLDSAGRTALQVAEELACYASEAWLRFNAPIQREREQVGELSFMQLFED